MTPPPRNFETDLNDRERARIAESLRFMAKQANDAADAIERRDDNKFLPEFLILMLTSGATMKSVMKDISGAMKSGGEEFPEFIGDR